MNRKLRPLVEPLEAKALPSTLAVSLLTDRGTYRAGEIVHMVLTEKNVSAADVTVEWGPSIAGFAITHDGAPVWRSNSRGTPEFIAERALAPGQSITLCALEGGTGSRNVRNSQSGDAAGTRREVPCRPGLMAA